MTKVFKALGVTGGTELIEKYGDLGSAFDAVNGKINELNINTGKAWGSTEALAGVTALTTTVNDSYVSTLDDMTNGTNALNGAFEKQNNTAAATMQRSKNQMQSLAITLGNAVIPLLNELMKAVTPVIKSFAGWVKKNPGLVKGIVKVAAVVGGMAAAISVVSGVVGLATKAFGIYKTVLKAGQVVTKIITAAQWLWNAAMMANPIGLIIAGVAALTVGIYALTKAFSSQTTAEKLNAEVRERALDATLDLRAEVSQLFFTLRKAEKGSTAFNETLARLEEIQPGIVEQFNLMEGKLNDINAAEKALKASILERAEAEARAEMIKEKFKEAQEARDKGGTGSGILDFALSMSPGGEGTSKKFGNWRAKQLEREDGILAEQQADAELKKNQPAENVNPLAKGIGSGMTSIKKEQNEVNINVNAPDGTTVTGTGGTGVNLSSTRK